MSPAPHDLLHRVVAIATGGLDALTHHGAVITPLGVCGRSHRQSQFDIFTVAVLVPGGAFGTALPAREPDLRPHPGKRAERATRTGAAGRV